MEPMDCQDFKEPIFKMYPNVELVLAPTCEAFDFQGSCAQMQSVERAFWQENVIGIS